MIPEAFQRTVRSTLDWLLPSSCLVCGAAPDSQQIHIPATLCPSCFDTLTDCADQHCDRCGAPLGPWASSTGGCPHCKGRRLLSRSVTCLGMYDGPLKQLLVAGKWSRSANNITTLARALIYARADDLRQLKVDRILPIPQSWQRRLLRHFNAAELVASEIAGALSCPVDLHVLRRSRRTKPQKRASLAERTAIQQGSFRVRDQHMIQGKRVLLVDDVLTTGATCNEAIRTLKQAGAKECHVAVLARVAGTAD